MSKNCPYRSYQEPPSPSSLRAPFAGGGKSYLRLTEAEIHGFRVSDASPETRAWIYSLEAEARTRAGDEVAAFAALDSAERALDVDGGRGAPRIAFFDRNRLLGERGVTAVRFNRTADGQEALEQVLVELAPEQKIRSRLLTSLAKAHIRHGSIDQAVEIALQSLDVAIHSDTAASYDDIVHLRPDLDRWSHTEPVRRLDQALSVT